MSTTRQTVYRPKRAEIEAIAQQLMVADGFQLSTDADAPTNICDSAQSGNPRAARWWSIAQKIARAAARARGGAR